MEVEEKVEVISPEFTTQEADALVSFIDIAVKSEGISAMGAASAVLVKMDAAVKALQAKEEAKA